MTSKEVKKIVNNYLGDNFKKFNNSQLAELILSENPNITFSKQTLRKYISYSRIEDEVIIIRNVPDTKKWSVIDNEYIWDSKRGKLKFKVEFIDKLFYEFSEKGLNLTQTQIINKHSLKVTEWNSIKSTFEIFKKSHIFSPYTVEITPKEDLDTMISEKMDKLFNSVPYQVEKKYEESLLKTYKKKVNEYSNIEVQLQTMVTELSDLLPLAKVQPIVRVIEAGVKRIITVHIFDIHFGAETKQELLGVLQPYNPEIVAEKFKIMAKIINSQNASEVHLFFGGDIVEDFGGNHHVNSWKGIAKGYYGAKLVKECYTLLVDFISSINNVKAIYGVSGNHDRAASDSKQESEGFIGELIFEFLNLVFKNQIDVIYKPKLVAVEVDNIVHLMSHGDKKFTDLNPAELILEYGIQGKYHLLTSGHWHERKIKKDAKNFRHIVCPSIFPGNDYSIDLGFGSNPGFIISCNNGFGKAVLLDYPL